MAIRDNRGKIPNYVISGGRLTHQPTGQSVPLPPRPSDEDLREAMKELVGN